MAQKNFFCKFGCIKFKTFLLIKTIIIQADRHMTETVAIQFTKRDYSQFTTGYQKSVRKRNG